MNIRVETDNDFKTVEFLTREAFWNVYIPGCTEHYVLHKLRQSTDFIPSLSLVVDLDGEIIGHIAYSKAKIKGENGKDDDIITFGPLSVSPKAQKNGVGAELIKYSLEKAAELGYDAVFIYGNPKYYYRFGFRSGEKFDIKTMDDKFAPALMGLELKNGSLKGVAGRFEESPDFHIDEGELVIFDKTFPPKKKAETETQKESMFLAGLKF